MGLAPHLIVKADIERAFNTKPVSDILWVNPPGHGGTENFPGFVFSSDKITGKIFVTIGGTESIAKGGAWHIEIWVKQNIWNAKSDIIQEALQKIPEGVNAITTGTPNSSDYVVFARKKFLKVNTKNIENEVFAELMRLKGFIKRMAEAIG